MASLLRCNPRIVGATFVWRTRPQAGPEDFSSTISDFRSLIGSSPGGAGSYHAHGQTERLTSRSSPWSDRSSV